MNFTLTLGETCELLIAIALFILLVYCISLIRHLIPSVKSLARVMKDVEVITESAAKTTKSAEGVVTDVADVTTTLISSLKTPAGFIGHITAIVSAVKAIIELASGGDDDEASGTENDSSEECTGAGTEKAAECADEKDAP